jgi:hypothetical protein
LLAILALSRNKVTALALITPCRSTTLALVRYWDAILWSRTYGLITDIPTFAIRITSAVLQAELRTRKRHTGIALIAISPCFTCLTIGGTLRHCHLFALCINQSILRF